MAEKRNGVVLRDPQGKVYRTLCVYDENDNLIGFIMEHMGEALRNNLELVIQSQIMVQPEETPVPEVFTEETPKDVPMLTMWEENEGPDGAGDFADELDDED